LSKHTIFACNSHDTCVKAIDIENTFSLCTQLVTAFTYLAIPIVIHENTIWFLFDAIIVEQIKAD